MEMLSFHGLHLPVRVVLMTKYTECGYFDVVMSLHAQTHTSAIGRNVKYENL